MPRYRYLRRFLCGFLRFASGCAASAALSSMAAPPTSGAVHPRFDLSSPDRSPFPSDRFTVTDPGQNTGRRVNLPMPHDCIANASDCEDVAVLNQLDGFNIRTRLSIPFDGDIDPASVGSDSMFLISLGDTLEWSDGIESLPDAALDRDADEMSARIVARHSSFGARVGVNQVVWDPETRTLNAMADELLDEHAHYAMVVTRGIRDALGNAIQPAREFERYRRHLASQDHELRRYARRLLLAHFAARRAGVHNREIAALSFFSTQSVTYLVAAIRREIAASTPPPANFALRTDGGPAIFELSSIGAMTHNEQRTTGPILTARSVDLSLIRAVPGAVGHLAFGQFISPSYMIHPGEYIPEIPTRTGTPVAKGVYTIGLEVALPSGPRPPGGWPVRIVGHGGNANQHVTLHHWAASAASRGIATVAFSFFSNGFGPSGTLTIRRTDGSSVTIPSPGRAIDQNGDGRYEVREGFDAMAPRSLTLNNGQAIQSIADTLQLIRVIQVGVDIDGDGSNDLDPERIYYSGQSYGSMIGMSVVPFAPEIRAAAFVVPAASRLDARRFSGRSGLGTALGRRAPSLLNSAYGVTSIDGVAVPPPFFNENMPLRAQPPVVNVVPGAMAIQQFLDRSTWAQNIGDPLGYLPLMRRGRELGREARRVLVQLSRGDQFSPNPSSMELIRAGRLDDRTAFYRHDLFYRDHPTVPKNPHGVIATGMTLPVISAIARGAQDQLVRFLESDGALVVHPAPAQYWEVPIARPLPEGFGFIR